MADIKTVVTTYGEYIGEIEEGADVIRLKNPRMVIQSQEGFWFCKRSLCNFCRITRRNYT